MKKEIESITKKILICTTIQEIVVVASIILALFLLIPVMISESAGIVLLYAFLLVVGQFIIYSIFEYGKKHYRRQINKINNKIARREYEEIKMVDHARFEEFNRMYKGM